MNGMVMKGMVMARKTEKAIMQVITKGFICFFKVI